MVAIQSQRQARASAHSEAPFGRANHVFPGGTTRATVQRSPMPIYAARGDGAFLVDVDENRFLDLNNNFTVLIHGHGFLPVCDAVGRLLHDGTCFSNPTIHELPLAELLCDRIPAVERVRFVNTGTEAIMFTIKAARAITGRPAIARIEGAYHGAYDWAEVGQPGTPSTCGGARTPAAVPSYPGQPLSVLDDVVVLPHNDADGARDLIVANADRLACVLIDPFASRAGLIPPDPAFVAAVAGTAKAKGILVVCDEVLNLRQGYQGASARYGLEPDLIAMGKIIGGGFPIGAVGGSERAMRVFDGSSGKAPVTQAGTFSANPVSMVAGYECMKAMTVGEFDRLERLGARVRRGLEEVIQRHGSSFSITGAASLFRIHARPVPPRNYRESYVTPEDGQALKALSEYFLDRGVLLPIGAAASLSSPMTEADVDYVVSVFDDFAQCRASSVETQ